MLLLHCQSFFLRNQTLDRSVGCRIDSDRSVFLGLPLLDLKSITGLKVTDLADADRQQFRCTKRCINPQNEETVVSRLVGEGFFDLVDPLNGPDGFNLDSRPTGRMVPFLTVFSLLVRYAKSSVSKRTVGENYMAITRLRQQKEVKKLIKTIGNVPNGSPDSPDLWRMAIQPVLKRALVGIYGLAK